MIVWLPKCRPTCTCSCNNEVDNLRDQRPHQSTCWENWTKNLEFETLIWYSQGVYILYCSMVEDSMLHSQSCLYYYIHQRKHYRNHRQYCIQIQALHYWLPQRTHNRHLCRNGGLIQRISQLADKTRCQTIRIKLEPKFWVLMQRKKLSSFHLEIPFFTNGCKLIQNSPHLLAKLQFCHLRSWSNSVRIFSRLAL